MSRALLQPDVPLAPHTTMNLGGPARFFAACRTLEELRYGLNWAKRQRLPAQVLGGGSNTLFADEGFAGVVLKVELPGVVFEEEEGSVLVEAGAGEDWDALTQECVGRGLAGIECLCGIPGRVGATPIQNVGAYGQEVRETILRVSALDRQSLEPVEFAGEACGFAYRHSRFKGADRDRYLITGVAFRLRPDGEPQVRYPELRRQLEAGADLQALGRGQPALQAVRQAVLSLRRKKSMVLDPQDPNSRSVGSFFLNPLLSEAQFQQLKNRWSASPIPAFPTPEGIKVPAAWLVEQAGFCRGFRRGGAGISANHALALVNCGGTTRQVLELADQIQQGVRARFGVSLELEPVVVPYQ